MCMKLFSLCQGSENLFSIKFQCGGVGVCFNHTRRLQLLLPIECVAKYARIVHSMYPTMWYVSLFMW